MMNFFQELPWIATIIGSVVSWFAGRHSRQSDTIKSMQNTIRLLMQNNEDFVRRIAELNQQVVELQRENAELRTKISSKEERC